MLLCTFCYFCLAQVLKYQPHWPASKCFCFCWFDLQKKHEIEKIINKPDCLLWIKKFLSLAHHNFCLRLLLFSPPQLVNDHARTLNVWPRCCFCCLSPPDYLCFKNKSRIYITHTYIQPYACECVCCGMICLQTTRNALAGTEFEYFCRH